METRQIPGTTLVPSVVGMGCWAIGGLWWGDDVDDASSVATIQTALELGITLFDTAPLYGHGHADKLLVQALGSRRHDVIIATKVGVRLRGTQGHAQSDLSPEHIRQDAEDSLRRLGVDVIDLLQIHWPCEMGTPVEATMEALNALRDEGLVRYVGASNYNAEGLAALKRHGPIVSLQTPLSMVRSRYRPDLQAECLSPNAASGQPTGVIAYEPLCRGLLTGKYAAPPRFAASDVRASDDWFHGERFLRCAKFVRVLQRVAHKLSVPVASLAVAWVCRQPGVRVVLTGAKRPSQIQENAYAPELLAHEPLWAYLDGKVEAFDRP